MTWIRLSLPSIHPRLGIALLALASGIALSALTGYDLYLDRTVTIEASHATTQNLARLLEEQARQSLRRIELLSLGAAQEIYDAGGPARADPAALRQRLRARLPADGLIRAFVLIGPTGAGMLSTLDEVERHLPAAAERDFFSAQRERAGLGAVLGAPFKSGLDGKWLLPVSVRLAAPAGMFHGVLLALVEPAHIQNFYASIDTGKNGFVTLFLREGWIAARVPVDERVMRRNWNDSPLFTQHLPRAPSDTVHQIVAADGVERLYSYRSLKDYPVIVTVGVSLTDALADWRERAWRVGLLLLLALAVVSGALMALLRQLKRRETAETALRESEARNRLFASAVKQSADAIFTHDLEGIVTVWNAAATRLFGFTAEEAVGRPIRELHLAGVSEAEYETVRALFKSLAPEAYEARRHARDGTPVDLFVTNAPMFDENGTQVAKIISMTDITERKRAQAALAESEERYRTLVEWSPEPFFVHQGGNIIYANPAAIRMIGAQSAQDLMGKPILDLVHPDFHQIARTRINRMIDDGVSVPLIEYIYLKLDGTPVDVEVQGTAIVYAGAPAVHISVRDISARKRAQAALVESEERYRTLVEWSPEPFIVHRGGEIIYVNPATVRLLGATCAQDLAGKSIFDRIHPEDRQSARARVKRIVDGNPGTPSTEMRFLRLDGTLVDVEILGTSMDYAGAPAVHASLHDISARKRDEAAKASLEMQLRESQKMEAIGTLAGGIAHDFNNIIAAILGNAELARQDASANPRALESLEEIRKAGARARALVQQILSFSRRQPTERKRIALAGVIEESVRLLRATLPARVALEVDCAADAPLVLADATQIEQVIINLASNAMQAMRGTPGRIGIRLDTLLLDAALANAHPALRAQLPERKARLVVEDDGPGMDPATLARIFEPFFTTKPVDEGTGLGLAVVHGIVTAHEGTITVESEVGKGTRFTLYLPVVNGDIDLDAQVSAQSEATSSEPASPAPGPGEGQRILYLDDDEALVFLMTRLLGRRGYRVSGYVNQREALAALGADPAGFDLVLTDYNMPGMSGLDVAREVRAIRADLPVAIASGFIDAALSARAAEAGVRDLIFKAATVEEFCATVQRLAQSVA